MQAYRCCKRERPSALSRICQHLLKTWSKRTYSSVPARVVCVARGSWRRRPMIPHTVAVSWGREKRVRGEDLLFWAGGKRGISWTTNLKKNQNKNHKINYYPRSSPSSSTRSAKSFHQQLLPSDRLITRHPCLPSRHHHQARVLVVTPVISSRLHLPTYSSSVSDPFPHITSSLVLQHRNTDVIHSTRSRHISQEILEGHEGISIVTSHRRVSAQLQRVANRDCR